MSYLPDKDDSRNQFKGVVVIKCKESEKPSKCEQICDMGECDDYWTAESGCENCPGLHAEEEDWERL